jgi:hypothetical protein
VPAVVSVSGLLAGVAVMKTAGIAIDNWKLQIFRRHLEAGGFSYTEHPGLTSDAMILKVKTPTIAALQPIVEAAQKECGNARKNAH